MNAVVIGPSGRARRRRKIVLGLVVMLAYVAVVNLVFGHQILSLPVMLQGPILGATVAWSSGLLSLGTVVTVDDGGVRIRGGRGPRGTWAWSDVREVGFWRQSGVTAFAVRPTGSVWDTPGPTAPVIAYPPVPGDSASRERLATALAAVCERQGVPFTTTADAGGTAPPGSPLRTRAAPP